MYGKCVLEVKVKCGTNNSRQMREAWQVRQHSEITERDAHCQASSGCSACRYRGKEEKTRGP